MILPSPTPSKINKLKGEVDIMVRLGGAWSVYAAWEDGVIPLSSSKLRRKSVADFQKKKKETRVSKLVDS